MENVFTFDSHDVVEVKDGSIRDDVIDWGLHTIMAPVAWERARGRGVRVAVLDTGIAQNHPDLRQNIRGVANFTSSSHGPEDVQGHGSHCAGIIAAADNGKGIIGVAPDAEIYSAKVLGDNGGGNIDSIIKGVRWAIAQDVDVISMSLGTSAEPPRALHDAIKDAVKQGIILVAATGNENSPIGWPAKYPEVIAVSALDKDYDRADFSNFGLENEIIAPGVDILSTYLKGGYAKLSGTSMATPIIAGAAALFIGDFKSRHGRKPSVKETHQALLRATVDLGQNGKDQYFGVGLINLAKLF